MTLIENNAVVLLQGDSVTDCGRNYNEVDNLGTGYAYLIAAEFGRKYPEKNVTFLNRGISGNRVVDLQDRWQQDCLNLAPTWVSILIGINDTWRRYDNNDPTSVEQYYEGYRKLLQRTKESTDANLIIMEPFLLPVTEEQPRWREDLDPKIGAARQLAREFNTLYVPLDGLFASASTKVASEYWAGDGVHPTPAGHGLIADAWLKAVRA